MENLGAESPSLTQIKCLRVFGTQGTPAPQSQPPWPMGLVNGVSEERRPPFLWQAQPSGLTPQ